MKPSFWIRRFAVVLLSAFLILLVVGLLKHRPLERALTESAIWAVVTAIAFVTARIYHSRRGQHCALCRDTPEMASGAERAESRDVQARK